MKQFLFFSFVLLCIAHQYTFSQAASPMQKVITFDKLQKTIIPIPACSQPNVKIEPALAGYKLEMVNGKYALVFDKPVSEGVYAITLTSGNATEKIEWRVLPTGLEERAMRFFPNIKLYYGLKVGYGADRRDYTTGINLRLQTDDIPSSQFFIRTAFDGIVQPFDRYKERFLGTSTIPASAKKVKIEVVWEYPPTKEEVVLASSEREPEQIGPDIYCYNAFVKRKDWWQGQPDSAFQITVKGIAVDYDIPIDADNSDPSNSKSIHATLKDVRANEEVKLDYGRMKLQLGNGGEANPNSKWVADSSTFYVISGVFDKSDGTFPVTIQVKGLPRIDVHELFGTIVLRAEASIWNEKAGKNAVSASAPEIPISIPLNVQEIPRTQFTQEAATKKTGKKRK